VPPEPLAENSHPPAPPAEVQEANPAAAEQPKPNLEERWGIRVLGVRLTSGGYMIDFRYQVTDAAKAAPLFDRKVHPVLMDEATGAKMAVPNPPKIGPLRPTGEAAADRNYFMLFANPGNYIKSGSKITVQMGDFRAEHLIVE
jgi:hypothetical protein